MAQLAKSVNPYELIGCPICYSTDSEILTRNGQFDIPLNVSICKACGFVFLNPRWSRERYQSFYESSYDRYYERDPADTDEDTGYVAMVQRLRLWKGDMDLSAPLKILDIGAGLGQGLTTLKRTFASAELFGIEPSIEGSRSFSEKGIKLVSHDVDSSWQDEYESFFDVVVMRHVLEHFLDPHSVLEKVFRVLANDGFLYVAVPSTDYAEFPLSKRFFRVVHTLYFSTEKLGWILEKHGLGPKVLRPGNPHSLGEIYAICVPQTQRTDSAPSNEYDAL